MHELPTGTVTLLFTDMAGSTRLLQLLGKRYADVLAECRDLMRAAFHQHHGHEIDIQGDAFFVAFARASDAISAAVTAQRALAGHSWPEGVPVRVRMGLHTGEPDLASEGYVGLSVHHAARIMSAGHGGQVLLSQVTCDLVEHDLPERVSLLYWLLSISVPKKCIHAGSSSTFSLQSTNQISGVKISCMPLYFLIVERIY